MNATAQPRSGWPASNGGQDYFPAPWSRALKILSAVATLAFCIPAVIALTQPQLPQPLRALLLASPPLGVFAGLLFMVRGYEVTNEAILVRRWLWNTRLPLAELTEVSLDPEVSRRVLRVCGNGGFFSFTGYFWSKSLGVFRMLATDHRASVLLRFRRAVLVSPGEPEAFVERVRRQMDLYRRTH